MGRQLPYFGSYSNGTGVIFSNTIGGTQRTITSTSPALPLNKWYCYGFTTSYDGTNTTMSVYIDGTLRSSATYPGAQSNASYRFTVGDGNTITASPYQWLPFTGQLSDVAVYPRTLTASELREVATFQRKKLGL